MKALKVTHENVEFALKKGYYTPKGQGYIFNAKCHKADFLNKGYIRSWYMWQYNVAKADNHVI